MDKILSIEFIGTMHKPDRIVERFPSVIGMTTTDSLEVGSSPRSVPNIVLKHPGISRRHARIFFNEGHWFIEDMGSDNGTWLVADDTFQLADLGKALKIDGQSQVLFGTVVADLKIMWPVKQQY